MTGSSPTIGRLFAFELQIAVLACALLIAGCSGTAFDKPAAAVADPALERELAKCNDAIRLNPNSAEAYWDRAQVYSRQHNRVEAIKDFTKAIRLAPNSAGAFNSRGLEKSQLGQHDSAIEDFTEAMRIDPEFPLPYVGRGGVWERKGDHRNAFKDYDEAIRIAPQYATAYCSRGYLWFKEKSFDNATRDFSKAVEYDPNYAMAYERLAWIQATCPNARFRDGAKAVENATKACELSSWTYSIDVNTLAAAYAEAGDFDAAVKYEDQAMKLEQGNRGFIAEARQRILQYQKRKALRDN